MGKTIRELQTPSSLMNAIRPQMIALRGGYEGGPAFKNAVLVKRPSEDAALFRDKLINVAALPICKAVVDEIVDVVFESEPTRHPAFLTNNKVDAGVPLWWNSLLEDADLNGNSFTAVMEKAATMAGIEGWVWMFVDLPASPDKNNRPYISVCPAENVIDWTIYTEYGRDYFEYLKVIEYEDFECTIYRLWYCGDAKNPTICERYIVKADQLENLDQEVEPNEVYTLPQGLPIPVVQFQARQDQRRADIGVSDLTETLDVQREMFKLEAEAYDSIRFSKPMIRAAAGIRVPAGGGGIIRGDKDSVEVFNIPTQDIAEIRAQQESLITRLDGFLGRGSMRTTRMQVQSGISIIEERRALHRKAAQRARQCEAAEQELMDLVAAWMGLYFVGDIDYETDYEDKDTQFRMALLQTAQQLSATNPVVQQIIDQEVIKMISPPDQTAEFLAKIGVSLTTQPDNAQDYAQADLIRKTGKDTAAELYGGEIQDKGVTTNDPIARQLIMLGVGR
jgi:hypothetical protein